LGIQIPAKQAAASHFLNDTSDSEEVEVGAPRPTDKIPTFFDAREKWHKCAPYIGLIRDQSGCKSCWAVAAASVITDRLCISKTGAGQTIHPPPFQVSETDILSCSGAGDCEEGGYPYKAMQWVERHRVVSGSSYGAESYCKPYPFPPKSPNANYRTPACVKKFHFIAKLHNNLCLCSDARRITV
jgi:hypothetical protein